jgi:hypothetical protein
MNPHALSVVSTPAKGRGGRPHDDESAADMSFLLALSRAFLMSVNAGDRNGTIRYSRAMLKVMNSGHGS